MKLFFTFFLLLTNVFLFAQDKDDLPARPYPPKLVNDLANIINDADEIQLENKLVQYNDSTSTQIAVVTVKTVEPWEISDYAVTLGHTWGVGQKDMSNGIVLLIAVDDRNMWIATGYGTEEFITDARASKIYRDILTPVFQQEKYYEGIDAATDEMIKYLTGAYDGEGYGTPNEDQNIWSIIIIVIIILIILSKFFRRGGGGTTFGSRGPTYWGGGGFGG
ncbi:MAG: TPM domain-containing protein, partial [Chitinophagales bacterium]